MNLRLCLTLQIRKKTRAKGALVFVMFVISDDHGYERSLQSHKNKRSPKRALSYIIQLLGIDGRSSDQTLEKTHERGHHFLHHLHSYQSF